MTTVPLVLLVEDHAGDEELFRRAFRKAAVPGEIAVVRDGAEALDWLFRTGRHAGRDADATPRLVLLDLKLPKVDGLEVLRRLRAEPRTARLPVVVLTSSNREDDIRRSYELGANGFVRKAVDQVQSAEAVKRIAGFWLETNQPPPESGGRA